MGMHIRRVAIAGRAVGDDAEPFIVGEASINHNGSLDNAIAMVHAAKEAGCDAIKFATLKASEFCNPEHMISYRYRGEIVTEPEIEMFRRVELPDSAWKTIKDECDRAGIIFFSTPQNESDLKLLLEVGVPCIKVGSDDLTNLALIESYAVHGLPLILSTGMADPWDIREAAHVAGNVPLIVCVCTSEYPCHPAHANIGRVTTLRQILPEAVIGFSDHTLGCTAAIVASGLGACYFETHFTLDRSWRGPDHSFAKTPEDLEMWASRIRQARLCLGDGEINPTEQERVHRVLWRRQSGQQIRGKAA